MRDISFATILFGNDGADNIGVMYGYMESIARPTGMSRTDYLYCRVSNRANGDDMQLIAGPPQLPWTSLSGCAARCISSVLHQERNLGRRCRYIQSGAVSRFFSISMSKVKRSRFCLDVSMSKVSLRAHDHAYIMQCFSSTSEPEHRLYLDDTDLHFFLFSFPSVALADESAPRVRSVGFSRCRV